MKAIKKYGQNFLKNEKVLEKISSLVEVNEEDLILEIGPGMGALTKYLVQKKSNLLAYEIDTRMKEYLKKLESRKVKFIYDDFMKRNITDDIMKYKYNNLLVVANIPYYITTPIILKLIECNLNFSKIVLLVQKEFAERLGATHNQKEYNAFTLFVDYFYKVQIISYVSKNDFFPIPKVDSAVILLERKTNNNILNEEEYFKFIKEAFKNKRKTLKNNLDNYDWEKIKYILNTLGYQENVRAEEISKEDFKILWEKITK